MVDQVELLPSERAVIVAKAALRDRVFSTADDNLSRAVESAVYRMHNSEIARCLLRLIAASSPHPNNTGEV